MNPIVAVLDRILEAIGNVSQKAIGLWEDEPVAITGVITALLDAAIAFNAPIAPDQKTAVIAVVSAIGVLIARNRVTPV